jgi:hypothetical protein
MFEAVLKSFGGRHQNGRDVLLIAGKKWTGGIYSLFLLLLALNVLASLTTLAHELLKSLKKRKTLLRAHQVKAKVAFSYVCCNPINSDQAKAKIVLFVLDTGLIAVELVFLIFLLFALLVFKHLNKSEVVNLESS